MQSTDSNNAHGSSCFAYGVPGLDPLLKLSHFLSLSVQTLGQYLKTGPCYFFRVF